LRQKKLFFEESKESKVAETKVNEGEKVKEKEEKEKKKKRHQKSIKKRSNSWD
jgi:hypothetical protein